MKKIVILHIFSDDKFFDACSVFFDTLSCVENLYYFLAPGKNYKFKYITNIEKIKVFYSFNEYVKNFSNPIVDIIYLQGLNYNQYIYFKYIGNDKKVIWWCWGYEIYHPFAFRKPLIRLPLYKTLTKKYICKQPLQRINAFSHSLYHSIKYWYFALYRNKVIQRIDYFSPVLPIEFQMMQNECPFFKAKPFMLNGGPSSIKEFEFTFKENIGNVLIGNSLDYTNNHLDIFSRLHDDMFKKGQKVIVPMSYGNAFNKDSGILKKYVRHLHCPFIWLEKFIPYNEYCEIFSSVTHAIYGVMRQQAMGNIFLCLLYGIKVFLFKESIVYKQLIESGYFVFSIEDDLNDLSLQTLLSKEQAYNNFQLFMRSNINKEEDAEKEFINIMQ